MVEIYLNKCLKVYIVFETNVPLDGFVPYSPVIVPSLATKVQVEPRLLVKVPFRKLSAFHMLFLVLY